MKAVLVVLLLATLAFAARVNYTHESITTAGVCVYDNAGNLLSRTVTAAQPESSARKPPLQKEESRRCALMSQF